MSRNNYIKSVSIVLQKLKIVPKIDGCRNDHMYLTPHQLSTGCYISYHTSEKLKKPLYRQLQAWYKSITPESMLDGCIQWCNNVTKRYKSITPESMLDRCKQWCNNVTMRLASLVQVYNT